MTDIDDVVSALRLESRHDAWGRQCALDLLIQHRYWLTEVSFREYVELDDPVSPRRGYIHWQALADNLEDFDHMPAKLAILRLACSLAGCLPLFALDEDGQSRGQWKFLLQPIMADLEPGGADAVLAAEAVRLGFMGKAGR